MIRRLIVLVTLLIIGASAPQAATPVSMRVIGGFTGALESGLAYETDRTAPIFGFGARYSLTEHHSIFLDAEMVRRKSAYTSPAAPDEPQHRELNCYPVTLGYQFSLPLATERLSPFLAAGFTRARYTFREQAIVYPDIVVPEGQSVYAWNESQAWGNGFSIGAGCSASFFGRFSLSGVMLYRYLHDPHLKLGVPADTSQNPDPFPITGFESDSPDWTSLSGLEGRILLEFRL